MLQRLNSATVGRLEQQTVTPTFLLLFGGRRELDFSGAAQKTETGRKTGRTHAVRYMPPLLARVQRNDIDPSLSSATGVSRPGVRAGWSHGDMLN
jgi:hypothetical protein